MCWFQAFVKGIVGGYLNSQPETTQIRAPLIANYRRNVPANALVNACNAKR